MANAVSLNDVARMLSTKGGDMSTIGGAIGCMTAMISSDARDKENTTSNDVRKIKEFIYGDGGSLSSMIDRIQLAIADQTLQIQKLLDGNKEKRLVKSDITKIIKSATNGLEKRLDRILDSLSLIAKNQGGNVKWGSTKKTKDSIEQFKASLSDKKKMKESRIGKLVSMLTELKAISFKDLLLFKPKMKLLEKLNPQINSFAKSLNEQNIAKVSGFLDKSPKMIENLKLTLKLAKRIKEKDLERFYNVLGIRAKSKKPKRKSLLGLINVFAELDKQNLDNARKNAHTIFGIIKDICLGIGVLVLFSPVIIVAGLLSKPLEWAIFGSGKKGDGGIMGIFKKLAKRKKDIKEANKSILWMSLGFVTLGVGLGVLFSLTKHIKLLSILRVAATTLILGGVTVYLGKVKDNIKQGSEAMLWMSLGIAGLGLGLGVLFSLTKNIEWEQMAQVAVSIAGFGLITSIFGQISESIKEGSKSMLWMSLGIAGLGLGLGVLFSLTKNVEWEQMAMIGVSMVFLGGATVALGVLNKSGLIIEGAIAMAVMGASLIPFGISMRLIMGSVRGLKWEQFGVFATATLTLGGMVIGLGAMMASVVGAIAWGLGLTAIASLGAALIPFGIGLRQISKGAKEIDINSIKKLSEVTNLLFNTLGDAVGKKKRKNAVKNAKSLLKIAKPINKLGKALKNFNDVAPDSIEKAMKSIEKISEFFFGENGISKYSTNFFKRIKSKAEANTISKISGCMHNLAYGLKTFNDVAPDSIEKAMSAIEKIAFYFFSPDSKLNTMNTGWAKRRKAKKTADAIGVIADCVYKLATGLKNFNDVAPSAINSAQDAIEKIAFYFFSPDSKLNKMNTGWAKRRKAKKTADAIGVIADSMYKVSQALKDFQEVGGKVIDRMIESIDKIVKCFFKDMGGVKSTWVAWMLGNSMEYVADAIKYFDEETKNVDTKKMKDNIEAIGVVSSEVFGKWKSEYADSAKEIYSSMKLLTKSFDDVGRNYRKNLNTTRKLFKQMSNPSFVAAGNTLRSTATFVRAVNTVDMEKASSLTDMFKSFASLGKTSNIFSSFDKRVKQFTDACIKLVNAINGNTDAINNSEEEVVVKDASGEEKTVKRKDAELMPKQMMILNVDDLAMAIADQLNSLNVDCDANINLQINNESGNEWRISRM